MKIYRDNPETLEEHLTAEGVLLLFIIKNIFSFIIKKNIPRQPRDAGGASDGGGSTRPSAPARPVIIE